MNLELPENGTSDITDTHDVAIPIGYVLSNADNSSIKLTNTDGSSQEIKYSQHAVDLAMVLTVSKAQGSTFSRAILLLEGSQQPKKCRDKRKLATTRSHSPHAVCSLRTCCDEDLGAPPVRLVLVEDTHGVERRS
ncbi:hypothetical protein JG688_00017076 [Phytophthora aleatoria]|uniref:Uncharacterized protein n=1 Tax=Phytophthora aleatoria TaxID=2496075 RepID=A0A8J5M1K7_9STRA|nr:hypothetical protein JG688_00017076 [Phytophthora aleatoria]